MPIENIIILLLSLIELWRHIQIKSVLGTLRYSYKLEIVET